MTTINAHRLQRLITQTRPHVSPDESFPAINGIRFECDGVHIHALATDRYTFAAARTKVREETEAWAITIDESDLDWFTAWVMTHEGDTILNLTATETGLTVTGDRGSLVVPGRDETFPKWQGMCREALENASSGDLVNLDTDMLARWKAADTHLRVWQTEAEKPVVIIGHDFIGMQMPSRYGSDGLDRDEVIAMLRRFGTGEAEQMEALPEPGAVAELAEQMLRQTLRSTTEMFGADFDTEQGRGAFNAWVHSGIYAWSSFRLLEALRKADPDFAKETVRDLNEQLESGEIGEWAWDAAVEAGHDPQQWHDDYEAHKKQLAEKQKAAEAAA